MEIFISWSGEKAEKIANELRDWFPKAIQASKPWFSSSDIKSGGRWLDEVTNKLEDINFGIICITPESINSSWVAFEAGALSKTVDSSFVCPLVFGVEKTDVKGPLSQFQIRVFEKVDFFKLVQTINQALGDGGLSEPNLYEVYEIWWPNIELKINNILESHIIKTPRRKDSDVLLEILDKVRGMETRFNSPKNFKVNESKIFEILTEQMEEKEREINAIVKKLDNDALTGLKTRRVISEIAQQHIVNNHPFSILVLDLNGFKQINDVYGYETGDEILIIVAKRLELAIGENDHASRLGGDEFLLILSETNKETLKKLTNKFIELVSAPMLVDGEKIGMGVAIGISSYPTDGENLDVLLEIADREMYLSKNKE